MIRNLFKMKNISKLLQNTVFSTDVISLWRHPRESGDPVQLLRIFAGFPLSRE